jgi:hypothetical protein
MNSQRSAGLALAFSLTLAATGGSSLALAARPKYGPDATLLAGSHEFINESPAPDYWALSPYYVGQQTDSACSLATVAMIVNAARAGQRLSADDELATQSGLLKRLHNPAWERAVAADGDGVSLEELKPLLEASLKAFGVRRATVEATRLADASAGARERLHKALVENEKSAQTFIVANFLQGVFTGDAQVGHFAPVGAYDEKRKRVLIMDPDRKWYEPYWVPEETFLKGMATIDSASHRARGYLTIRLQN